MFYILLDVERFDLFCCIGMIQVGYIDDDDEGEMFFGIVMNEGMKLRNY